MPRRRRSGSVMQRLMRLYVNRPIVTEQEGEWRGRVMPEISDRLPEAYNIEIAGLGTFRLRMPVAEAKALWGVDPKRIIVRGKILANRVASRAGSEVQELAVEVVTVQPLS